MSLDVFDPTPVLQNAQANLARDLPAGFGESFDVAWRAGTEFNNSAAYSIARERALVDYSDDIYQRTGERLPYVGVGDGDVSLEQFNDAQAKLSEKYPINLQPLSEGDINSMTLTRMAKAHADAAAFANRETTWSGTAGSLAGTLAGGLADPVMAATAPLGGAGEVGIALRALEFAGIAAGSTAVSAGLGYGSREAAVPGSGKEIPGEIAGAALSGAVLGGAFGLLGRLLEHGAKPLPTSVRDDVNAATSEFQFNATNPFPTAGGEAAARDATLDATRALVDGDKVTAADGFAARHVADYALAAKATTADELGAAGEQFLHPDTAAERPDVQLYDRLPTETETAADYWDRRLSQASPDERAALGATDDEPALVVARRMPDGTVRLLGKPGEVHSDLMTAKELRADGPTPPEIADAMGFATADGKFLTRQEALEFAQANEPHRAAYSAEGEHGLEAATYNEATRPDAVAPADLTREQETALAVDPQTDEAVLRNLDRIRADNPDAQFTTQVRQADGSYQLVSRPLEDVMDELDRHEALAKELEACAVGMEAAE